MKQTAVEWLVDKLEIFATEEEMNVIEQAKEMEEQRQLDLIRFMRTSDKMGKSVEDLYKQFKSE